MFSRSLCCFILTLPLLLSGQLQAQEAPQSVSMIQLIANPEKYDGKFVRVHGFLRLEFEGNGLYLHQEDYKESLYSNGLWINLDFESNRQFSMKYVLIEGTFDSKDKGHMGLWSGAIKNVKRIDLWGRDSKTDRDRNSSDKTNVDDK